MNTIMLILTTIIMVVVVQASPYQVENIKQESKFSLLMPNAKPTQPETYLCTTIRLDRNTTNYITGFTPQADMGTAHHMLLFGCKEPGVVAPLFSCGEMGIRLDGTKQAPPCRSGQEIIYGWAKNAPSLSLPPGVGFHVGGSKTGVDYLVLQVHYASVDKIPATGDRSGVTLTYTEKVQSRRAGVYVLETGGMIPAKSTSYMEAACKLNTKLKIHPFAFRTHTHALGRVVSGWKVSEHMEWDLVGKKDPQLPQMFYPTRDPYMTMTGGDTIAARCTMVSHRNRITWVGATAKDEMCNFYMMYWVEGQQKMKKERCFTLGPPVYAWDRWIVGGGLTNIPDKEASSLA